MQKAGKSLIKASAQKDKILTYTEQAQLLWEKHNRQITYVLIGIVVLVGGWIGWNMIQKANYAKADYEEMLARDAFARSNYDEALTKAEAIIADYSGSPAAASALMMQGRIYESRGEYDLAIKSLEKLISKHGDQPYLVFGARYAIGAIHNGRGEYEKAVRYYKRAAISQPDHFQAATALLDAGRVYRKMNKRDDAKQMFRLILNKYATSREATDARSELSELEFQP